MTRWWTLAGVTVVFAAAVATGARQASANGQNTFRTAVDLVRIDVTVIDRNRNPVHGLTAPDFTIVENGKPRPVLAVAEIELEPPDPTVASWVRDAATDVVANDIVGSHALVVVIDDGTFGYGATLHGLQTARTIATAALDQLGPRDIAAVVFTQDTNASQGFTLDRTRLRAAVARTTQLPASSIPGSRGACPAQLCSVHVLRSVVETLEAIPDVHRTILYISNGLDAPLPEIGPYLVQPGTLLPLGDRNTRADATIEAIRAAQRANITVHAFEPNGLGGDGTQYPEFLRTVAENTGGRAVVNDNDPERVVPAIMREARSYYLVGFTPAAVKADGAFHPITVTVKRPDVDVRARRSYVLPEPSKSTGNPTAGLDQAMARDVPVRDVPLSAVVSPWLGRDGKPALAAVLGITQATRSGEATPELTARLTAVDELGRNRGESEIRLRVKPKPGSTGDMHYEVLAQLPAQPGRYEVRVGASLGSRVGTVQVPVDVPDFANARLAASGLVLSATPAPRFAPKDGLAGLTPVTPTTRREFAPVDAVVAMLRVYQKGVRDARPASIRTRILDTSNKEVVGQESHLDAASFAPGRTADYRFDVPVERLAQGDYLLTVDVTAGETRANRVARFRVVR